MESVTLKVARKKPELITPANPTPHEFKLLSDIDDQEGARFQIPGIQFYRRNPSAEGKDPVKVIRDAVGRALVFYYPLAGRLRERAGGKLVVECTGEGVLFIEADANVTLHHFQNALHPPFPCLEDLLYDVPGSSQILNSPLLFIQVTRLKCGGFILAFRLNHTMCDAAGIIQFMKAVGELALGAEAPSVPPVWDRHLLNARDPPSVTCSHPAFDDTEGTLIPARDDMVHRSFFFRAAEFSALRRLLPPHPRACSTFDLLTASLWRCRTIAISSDPHQDFRVVFIVNSRRKCDPPLPSGYYGNAVAPATATAAAGDLSGNPLHYAVELVRKAKGEVTGEYMKSLADLHVVRKRPRMSVVRSFVVSDVTSAGFGEVDFGWGKAVYGGPALSGIHGLLGFSTFYIPFKNNNGEDGILVPMCLPANAMEVFVDELHRLFKAGSSDAPANGTMITSAL